MPVIAGIDPGISGAIALVDTQHPDTVVNVWDMPTLDIKRGKTIKRRVDIQQLKFTLLDLGIFNCTAAYIEDVGGMPGQSAPAAFSFGYSTGLVVGMLACLEIPCTAVTATTWKRALKVNSDKDGCRYAASQFMPRAACYWPLKKHDGRAEAALIARYGAKTEFLCAA